MVDQVPTLADLYQAKRDVKDINTFTHSPETTFVDGDGITKLTLTGIESKADDVMAQIRFDFKDPLTFTTGATLNSNIECLRRESDGEYFRWAGPVPPGGKVVAPGTNPLSDPLYVAVGSAALRQDIRPRNGLKQLTPISGVSQVVSGFYSNSNTGGGVFIYDPTMSHINHDGAYIIASTALNQWSGSFVDISVLFNWTGSGNGCYLRIDDDVTLANCGALDGQDIRLSFEKADELAKKFNSKITGNGSYTLTGRVNLTQSFDGNVVIKVTSNSETDGIVWRNPSDTVVYSVTSQDLDWLREGSLTSNILGYDGFAVVIRSSETMTVRFGNADVYQKTDINILKNDGALTYPIDCTYTTLTGMSITLLPPSRNLVKGLTMIAENCNSDINLIDFRGFNGLSLDQVYVKSDQSSKSKIRSCIRFLECASVKVSENCDIKGGNHLTSGDAREGYGLNCFITANVELKCNVSECKSPLSGRHTFDSRITGGKWVALSGSCLDSHWCKFFKVTNATIIPAATGNAVGVAGSDVSVTNCNIIGGAVIVSQRGDTPSLKGSLDIKNINWETSESATRCFIFQAGVTEASNVGDFWGVPQPLPDNINIDNINIVNHAEVGSDLGTYILRYPVNNIPRIASKNINISNVNTTINKVSGVFFRRLVLSNLITQTEDVKIVCQDLKLGNLTNNFSIEKLSTTPAGFLASVECRNVKPLAVRVDVNSCSSFDLTNCNIIYAKAWSSDGGRPLTFDVVMNSGEFVGSQFYDTFPPVVASNVKFSTSIRPLRDWNNNPQIIHAVVNGYWTNFHNLSGCRLGQGVSSDTPISDKTFIPDITFENQGDLVVDWTTRVVNYNVFQKIVKITYELRFRLNFSTSTGRLYFSLPLTPKNTGLRFIGNCVVTGLTNPVFGNIRTINSAILTSTDDGARMRIQFVLNSLTSSGLTTLNSGHLVSGDLYEVYMNCEYEIN